MITYAMESKVRFIKSMLKAIDDSGVLEPTGNHNDMICVNWAIVAKVDLEAALEHAGKRDEKMVDRLIASASTEFVNFINLLQRNG